MSTINICFATDNAYATHCAVAIASVLVNSSLDDDYNIYVIDGGISKENKNIISKLENLRRCKIKFLSIDKKAFDNSYSNKRFTKAVYYRFLIPEIIDADKVIYLDSDVIAKKDISTFYNLKIDNYYMAAIEDVSPLKQIQRLDAVGLKIKSEHYYNSGVLLINCGRWRADKITRGLKSCMTKNKKKIIWPDQDIINYFLQEKIKSVSQVWNFQLSRDRNLTVTKKEIADARIIHFITGDKPWKPDSKQLQKEEYFKYLNIVSRAGKAKK